MELPYDFLQAVQDVVLRPDLTGAFILFWFSLINELVAVLPHVVLVSGQLLFIDPDSFPFILYKLFFFVAVPAGIGGALGSLLIYGIAYWGGKPSIERYKRYLRFSWDDVERVNARFKGAWYDEFIFLALRSMPVLPSLPINIAAGILRMPVSKYFIYTLIGFIIRMVVMFMFAWAGTEALSF